MSDEKVHEIIAELLRINMGLKSKITDIYGFRIFWYFTVNGVTWEIIANIMYEQILCKLKSINLPYCEKIMPNTAYLILQKSAKSGRV